MIHMPSASPYNHSITRDPFQYFEVCPVLKHRTRHIQTSRQNTNQWSGSVAASANDVMKVTHAPWYHIFANILSSVYLFWDLILLRASMRNPMFPSFSMLKVTLQSVHYKKTSLSIENSYSEPTVIAKNYETILFNGGIVWCYKDILYSQAMHLRR